MALDQTVKRYAHVPPKGTTYTWLQELAEQHGVELPEEFLLSLVDIIRDPRPITSRFRINAHHECLVKLRQAAQDGDMVLCQEHIASLKLIWSIMTDSELDEVINHMYEDPGW